MKKYTHNLILLISLLSVVQVFSQNTNTFTYIYDDLNRLTEVQYGNGTTIAYEYDKVGNRTQRVINAVNPHQPDVTPTNGALSLSTVGIGAEVTLTYNNENIGTGSTGSFSTLIVLSDNNIYEPGADEALATLYTPNLNAGAMPVVSEVLDIPADATAGSKHILILADYDDDVANELSEANNTLVVPITLMDCGGLSVSVTLTDETCEDENGAATTAASGGSGPYQYSWNTSPPQSGVSASRLSAGNYAVSVTDQTGCSAESSFTISNTGQDPLAGFNYSPSGLAVAFNNTSAFGTGYSWAFGDGNTSNQENPMHIYAAPGTYTVCLDVSNTCGVDQYCTAVFVSVAACEIPSGLAASSVTQTSATLGWSSAAGASSYNVRYRDVGAGSWQPEANTASATFILSGLTAGTSYEFQVEAVCGGGNSGYSNSYFFSTFSPAAAGGGPFYKTYDYQNIETYSGISCLTSDGYLLTTGYSLFNGRAQSVIFKTDQAGDIIWARKTHNETDATDNPTYVTPTNNGGFIYNFSRNEFTSYSPNGWSADLAKFDQNGNVVFQNYFEESGRYISAGGHSIQLSNGGFVKLAHNTNNSASVSTNEGPCLIGTNSQGALQWIKTFVTSDGFQLGKVLETSDNKLLFFGHTYDKSAFPIFPTYDIFVVKYNPSMGIIEWSRKFTAPDYERFYDLEETPDGYLFSGNTLSFSGNGNYDPILLKIDLNGNYQWAKTYSFPYDENAREIVKSTDGNLIIGCYFNVLKVDLSGNLIWANNTDPSSSNRNLSYHLVTNDSILISGYSNSGPPTLRDYHIMKLDENGEGCTTTSITPVIASQTLNQATHSFSLYTPTTTTYNLSILAPFTLAMEETIECESVSCNVAAGIIPSATTICAGETVTLFSTSSGADTYSWKVGVDGTPFSMEANANYTFAAAGTFTIYLAVTDGASCTDEASVVITVHEAPDFFVNTFDEQCLNVNGYAFVDVTTVNDPQVVWSTGATTSSINGLPAGNYSVQVTNANGCITTQNFTIDNTSNGFTVFGQADDVSCYGAADGAITVGTNGAQGNLSYNWSNGTGTNPISGLSPGLYEVTVSDQAGCAVTASYAIEEPQELSVEVQINHESVASAADAFATVLPSGGTLPYVYNWSNGVTTATALGLSEGSYTVTVTDARGCTASSDVNVFVQIEAAPGVSLFKKDFPGGNPDYVQIIDLEAGAYIELDTGTVTSGAGTANPYFTREDIDDIWTEKTGQHSNVFSVTNGQFFNSGQTPAAQLAFPVKEGDNMLADGYGNANEYIGEKLFLPIWSNEADVLSFDDDPNSVANSTAPQGIVGLHRTADKAPANNTGRTFAGVLDLDGDGKYEKVLIFTSKTATQAYAAGRLHDFGVEFDKIVMLDGGGSTQMKAAGTDYVTSTRLIPQYMVVYSAPVSLPSCATLTSPAPGAADVDIDADLSWNAVLHATGYRLTVGTTPGGTEILNNVDVGNVTTYDIGTLPELSTIYITIKPYNNHGTPVACPEESFVTSQSCPDLIVENVVVTNYGATSISYSFDIKNIGTTAIDIQGSVYQALISWSSSSLSGDVDAAGGFLITQPTVLQPGESISRSFNGSPVMDLCRRPYLLVISDNSNAIQECNEANNIGHILIDPTVICGCTDAQAHNYDPNATHDDGSCETCSDGILNGDEAEVDCGGANCPACQFACTQLTYPLDGATGIPSDVSLSWAAVSEAVGYRLTVGTSSGSTNILDNLDVGNVSTYDLGPLPGNQLIYITITPYNANGNTSACAEESFTTQTCTPSDKPALIALYEATNGDNWTASWDTAYCNICDWQGITCDLNGRVIVLDLNGNGLSGPIAPEIGLLDQLVELDLGNNQLSGGIPVELGNIAGLEILHLFSNQLSGAIPVELSNLANLQRLILWNNSLDGSIPVELGGLTGLTSISLSLNQLSGPIPNEFGNLINLQNLHLDRNQLSGGIPSELEALINLKTLYAYSNMLDGGIPPELGNLAGLEVLWLSDNQLSGSIPPQLAYLNNLVDIDLSDNLLSGCFHLDLGTLCSITYDFTGNTGLYSGGDFNVFCIDGTGACDYPGCSILTAPVDGSNVGVDEDLSWTAATNATGYKLVVGTTLGGVDLIDHLDVGPVTTYDIGTMPYSTTIFVSIIPYNADGDAIGCSESSFSTETGPIGSADTLVLSRVSIIPSDTILLTYNLANPGSVNKIKFGDGAETVLSTNSGSIVHEYTREGVFRPQLIIDNNVVDQKSLLARSCEWVGFVTSTNSYRESNEDFCQVLEEGVAHIDPNLTTKTYYWSRFANYNDFLADGDAVTLEVRVKNPQNEGGISCFDTGINLYGEKGNARVNYMTTGCDHYASIGAGTTNLSGSTSNLSALGQNLSNWHTIKLVLQNGVVSTYYDGVLKYSTPYSGEVGRVLGLHISFKGSGSVDWVTLRDVQGEVVYTEEFNHCECDELIAVTKPTLSSAHNDEITILYPDQINRATLNSTTLRVMGDEAGQREGTYSSRGNAVKFRPDYPFRAGEKIMISSLASLQDTSQVSQSAYMWERLAKTTNPTTATFIPKYAGITLPAGVMNYSLNFLTADVNRDGLLDYIFRYHAPNGASTNILVYQQQPDHTFSGPVTYTNSYSYSGLQGTPDLNNDGYPDIIVSHNSPSRAHVRLNNGDGTFSSPAYYTLTNYSNGFTFGDIDQDGDIDLVGIAGNAGLSQNTISILRNNGNGTFAAQETINTGVFGSGRLLADLDNDGDLDFAYSSNTAYSSTPSYRVYENNGGNLNLQSNTSNPDRWAPQYIYDFDQDGLPDIVNRSTSINIEYGTGGLGYSPYNGLSVESTQAQVLPGDLNGDGWLDLFANRLYDGSSWETMPFRTYLNQGNRAFQTNTGRMPLGARQALKLSDADSDGDVDAFYLTSEGELYIAENVDHYASLELKVLLQGPYDSGTGLMNDHLRNSNLLPEEEPYRGLAFSLVEGRYEKVHPGIFDTTGNNAIVDWVLVELRNPTAPAEVIATRSALLQRDGDVVDIDGKSTLVIPSESDIGSAYIAIRHRNHLGIRSSSAVGFSGTAVSYDFTLSATQAYGTNSMAALSGVFALWGGDANGDGKVYDNFAPSDAQVVSGAVLGHPGNTGFFGSGPVSNYFGFNTAYEQADVNMDGNIYDNFAPSDRQFISNSVLGHPANTGFFGSGPVSNFTGLIEQIDP